MSTQPTVAAQILNLPIDSIIPSKTNPRGRPSPEGILDLASDIEHRGVQSAIVVRPIPPGGTFEIVFGERRWAASKKAKKDTVPAEVRNLTDAEAYELQVIENVQREDLHPLQEAAAFQRMYEQALAETKSHDESIALVAEKLGKKRTPEYIAQRLQLEQLDPAAKTAFLAGDLLLGHANELARLRTEEQKAALRWLLTAKQDVKRPEGWKKKLIVPGVPELRLWIAQNLFLKLKNAPFDTADPTLNSQMGACTTCSFKTGNQPALFGDV